MRTRSSGLTGQVLLMVKQRANKGTAKAQKRVQIKKTANFVSLTQGRLGSNVLGNVTDQTIKTWGTGRQSVNNCVQKQ